MSTPITIPMPLQSGPSRSMLVGELPDLTYVGIDGTRHYLSGPLAHLQQTHGIKLKKIKGVDGPFKHLDQQGARQDGVDWLASYFDPVQLDMTISVNGINAMDRRGVWRTWFDGWSPYSQGKLSWTTRELGTWWMMLRRFGPMTSDLPGSFQKTWEVDWTARGDFPFWQSFPSSSAVISTAVATLSDPKGVSPNNFLPLFNRGSIPAWPEILLQGPGIFTMGDNGSLTSTRQISIQLYAREVVLLKTLPRRRSAVEVNTDADVFERLHNRFSQPVPPMKPGNPAAGAVQIPIQVTGAVPGTTAATATLTPCRIWPE